MTEAAEARIEEIAEAVESAPSEVGGDELTTLLEGSMHPEFDVRSPAGDALEELIEGLSESEIAERFDADRLRGRLRTRDPSAATALSSVLETLAETDPEAVRELRPEIRAGLGESLRESTIKDALHAAVETEAEVVAEARSLMATGNATARNLGVRLVKDLAGGRPFDGDSDPAAIEPAIADVWEVMANSRETSKPRENAAKALAAHGEARPEAYVDRMDEVAEILLSAEPKVRNDVFDLPQAIAAHDPDAVVPIAPVARREFEDVTATDYTRTAAMEFLGEIVDTHPEEITSLDPFVEYVEDDDNWYDESIARVVAAVGGPEHAETVLGAGEFDPELIGRLVDGVADTALDGLDREDRAAVRETIEDSVTDDDPETRVRALSTIIEVFHGELDDPAAVYLDRLVDQGADEHGYETVSVRAAEGLQRVAAEAPARLTPELDRLFEATKTAHGGGERSARKLTSAIATLAVTDESNAVYDRLLDGLGDDDGAVREIAVEVLLDGAAVAYPAAVPDPVPALLELHGDDEATSDAHIRRVVGNLAYARPDAVAPAVDPLIDHYEAIDDDTYDRSDVLADLGADYPEAPAALAEALAASYVDGFEGEYSHDDGEAAVAVGYAAMEDPDRVRSALAAFLDAPDDDRPGSFPLVLLGLGDHGAVPEAFAGEDGWLADLLAGADTAKQLRLLRFLAATGYEPAKPRLEALTAGAAASDVVADAAADALERLG